MRCKVMIYTAVLTTLLLAGKMAAAQQIYYSPFIPDSFDVAAKAGDLYWVESKAGYRPGGRRATSRSRPGAQTFDLYDSKLRWQALVSTGPLTPDVFKEYYLGSDAYFDQVYLRADAAGTSVTLNRYSAQGLPLAGNKKIADLPVWERASSFLLARSQDRTKILLLAFEAVPEDGLRLHALLFDADWQVLSYKSYHPANIAQGSPSRLATRQPALETLHNQSQRILIQHHRKRLQFPPQRRQCHRHPRLSRPFH